MLAIVDGSAVCAARSSRRAARAAAETVPSTRVGTIVRNRNTSTAARTPALLPPKPINAAVRLSSTTPIPPGVIGMLPRMRASDQAANASTTLTSDDGTWSARNETSRTAKTVRLPASVASVSRCQRRLRTSTTSTRKRSKLLPPHVTGPRWKRRFDPGGPPRRQVTDLQGHAVAVEDEHERSDDDAQDRHADERRRRQHRRLLSGHRQQEERHDRIRQVGELVPEAHQRHRPSDGTRREARRAATSRRRSRSRPPLLPARRSKARWSPGSSSAPSRSAGREGAPATAARRSEC